MSSDVNGFDEYDLPKINSLNPLNRSMSSDVVDVNGKRSAVES